MHESTHYCHACNETWSGERDLCPECNGALAEIDTMATPPSPGALDPASGSAPVPLPRPGSVDPLIGRTLGLYFIERLAGQGGMARVYRARHTSLGRTCALKVLSPELMSRFPDHIELFFAEARAAAGLVHANVVTVHNILEQDGLFAIEMEWVNGRSLKEELFEGGCLSAYRATDVMAQMCRGLAVAHRQHVIHRDLKPSNVLLADTGVAKLADFGLAKRLVSPVRTAHQLAGTPYFMAPELFRGALATPRSDVYAVGVTLFLLLTGEFPYRGPGLPDLVRLHREGPIPDVRKLAEETPDAVAAIVERCLRKREHDRFENGDELASELAAVLHLIRSLCDLFEQAIEGLDIDWRRESRDAVSAEVALPRGRRQRVLVEALDSFDGESLVRISSPCARVVDSYLRRALELNGRVHHGAIAIESIDGEDHFVMRNAYPRATCDPEELRESLLSVASAADEVEELLSGTDEL